MILPVAMMMIGIGVPTPPAYADNQTARVTVEGVVLGPAKKDGMRWDGQGMLSPQEQQLVAIGVGRFAAAYTGLDAVPIVGQAFSLAVTNVTKTAMATDQRPDAQGTAELFVGGRLVGKKAKLGEVVDNFTPQWPGKMEWSGVPMTEDVRIRIVLDDNDDGIIKRRPDPIGAVIVNGGDLARAAAAGKVFPVYVGDQSDDQIIAIKLSVMVESVAPPVVLPVDPANSPAVEEARAPGESERARMKPFTHAKGRLEIWMPGTPKEDSSVEQTGAGPIALWQASVILASKAYFVSYSDMPQSTWKGDVKKMLEGARDGAARRVNGRIVADKEIRIGKWPGREFKVVVDKMELTQRVYLIEHRLYQVNMGCLSGSCTDAEVQDYLNSFKVVGVE